MPDHCQPAVSKIDIYVTVVLNVSTDIYLISIPAPVHPPYPLPTTLTRTDAIQSPSPVARKDRTPHPLQRRPLCHDGRNPPLHSNRHCTPLPSPPLHPIHRLTTPERSQRRRPSRQLGMPGNLCCGRNRQRAHDIPGFPTQTQIRNPIHHHIHIAQPRPYNVNRRAYRLWSPSPTEEIPASALHPRYYVELHSVEYHLG